MNWFLNLKIREKLILVFSLIILLVLIIGYFSYFQLSVMNNLNLEFTSDLMPKTILANKIVQDVNNYRRAELAHIVYQNPTMKEEQDKRMETALLSFKKDVEIYSKKVQSKIEQNILDSVQIMWDAYLKESSIVLELSKQNNIIEAGNRVKAARQVFLDLTAILNRGVNYYENISKDAEKNASTAYSSAITVTIVGVILIIILVLYIGMFFSNKFIDKPIKSLLEKFDKSVFKIDEDHLKITSKDEIKILENYITCIINEEKINVVNFLQKSKDVHLASKTLLDISEIFRRSIDDLSSKVQSATSSSEEVSSNVATVAASSEEMTASIKEISKNTSTAAKIAREAQENANNASVVISHLGESSSEIGNILKEITSIAEQTNLLALNATIEAARAGELGKGFAVVANEVKELAKQAGKASEDISIKIKMVQDGTKNAVQVINGIIESIKNINDLTNTIASAVEEQTVTTSEVNRNLSDATNGVSLIVDSVASIFNATKQFSEESSNVRITSTDLQKTVDELNSELSKNYKISLYSFFENAIEAHGAWKTKLRTAIEGGDIPDENKVGLDNVCDFGKWIYNEGKKFNNLSEYNDLKTKHATFHKKAADIILLIKKGEKEKAMTDLKSGNFASISKDVVSSIRKLAEKI